jgi:uncharacterized protein (TIGR02271 family)
MSRKTSTTVRGKDGLRGVIEREAGSQRSGPESETVVIRLDDGRRIAVPVDLLELRDDGSYDLRLGPTDLDRPGSGSEIHEEGNVIVVPVVAEELEVRKRSVETGGVRVSKVVHEREEVVDEPLFREEVDVERVAINRAVDGPVATRQEGDVTIVPVLEEVLVVEKRLMLKEELRITRRRVEEHRPQRVSLRTEDATVERIEQPEQ